MLFQREDNVLLPVRRVRGALFYTALMLVFSSQALGASFDVLKESRFGNWSSVLYKNQSDGSHFCALESEASEITFRLNQYLDSNDIFIEFYNSGWSKIEGDVSFSLKFDTSSAPVVAEVQGKSWGDSYTYDILETNFYDAILLLISTGEKMQLLDSNGVVVVEYSLLENAQLAAREFRSCVQKQN